MSSPTQRSLKRLRDTGAIAGIVEKYNSFVKIRQDLFGFIDIVALDAGAGVLGVQTTSSSNLSARVRKVMDDEGLATIAKAWLGRGNRLEFHGWAKRGRFWRCRVMDLQLELGTDGGQSLYFLERPDEPTAKGSEPA